MRYMAAEDFETYDELAIEHNKEVVKPMGEFHNFISFGIVLALIGTALLTTVLLWETDTRPFHDENYIVGIVIALIIHFIGLGYLIVGVKQLLTGLRTHLLISRVIARQKLEEEKESTQARRRRGL